MKRKNFFILLELPFDPPVNDIAQIKAAIHNKSSEWSRQYSSPEQKSIAQENIDLIPQIEEVLLSDASRATEAAEAALIRGSMSDSFEAELRVLETKGYILPRELKELHQKYKPYGFDYDLVRRLVRVPVTDTEPKSVGSHSKVTALNRDTGLVIKEHLDLLRQSTLYTFLNRTPDNSAKELYNVASAIKHHTFNLGERDSQANATLLLADLSLNTFETEQNKAEYDLFLQINTLPELSNLIHDAYKRSGYISPEVLMRLVNFGITTYDSNVLELEDYIRRYCDAYGIDVNIASPQTTCPVCAHQSPRGTKFCPECSSPLEGNCPSCNTFFSDGAKICNGCGFSVGKMGLAIPFLESAKTELSNNNWVDAGHSVEKIQEYWPNHKELDVLKAKIISTKNNHENTIEAIEKAINSHKYYTASQLIESAKSNNLVVPSKVVSAVDSAINNFEKQLLTLTNRGSLGYDSLTLLVGQIADSLELNQLLTKYPPEPPAKLTVAPNPTSVKLSWDKSSSTGLISYVVVRKQDSMPLTAYDGDILYEGERNFFEDDTLKPLVKYFYSVYAKRSNSFSNMGAVTVSAVRIVPNVSSFLATPADSAAQLSWSVPLGVYQVKVWRTASENQPTSPKSGTLLDISRIDSYTDRDISNHEKYWYFATAVYKIGNDDELVESDGVFTEVTPHHLVNAVDQFYILPTEEKDHYFINWEGASGEDVIFFNSRTMPSYPLGHMIPMETLFANYNRIELDTKISNNGRFNLSYVGDTYIFPVVVSGKFGAMGAVEYLTNVPDVELVTYDIIGSDLFINFKWPAGSQLSVTATWSDDIYPRSVGQKGTSSASLTKEEYDYNAGFKIPDIAPSSYYFKIFTFFVTSESKKIYSEGVNLLVDNNPAKEFFYEVDYKKPLMSSLANVNLTLRSEHIFHMPRAILVGKVGMVPLNINDGRSLFEIEREQDIAGAITYKYRSELLEKNLFVRLFFLDDKYYHQLRPIPTPSLKVT